MNNTSRRFSQTKKVFCSFKIKFLLENKMFKRSALILMLFVSIQFTYAQSANLAVSLNENSDLQGGTELVIDLQVNQVPERGFLFELPSQTVALPFAISLNGIEFWLKNAATVPEQTNVAHWNRSESGIELYFNETVILTGEVLKVVCTPHKLMQTGATEQIFVREILNGPAGQLVTGRNLAQQNFPTFENNN